LRVPLVSGGSSTRDTRDAPLVAVINEGDGARPWPTRIR
jgi:hypothetical protein